MKKSTLFLNSRFAYLLVLMVTWYVSPCLSQSENFDDVISEKDSLQLKELRDKAYQTLQKRDTILFKVLNKELLDLASILKDTSGLAEYHWNKAIFFKNKDVLDSSYYHYSKAQEFYSIEDNGFYSGQMIYNMAFIRGSMKDYTGSEILLFDAISKADSIEDYKTMHLSYNYLGLVYTELEEYNKALFYYERSLEYLDNLKRKKTYKENTLNNIGLMYQKQDKYKRAIPFFEEALETRQLQEKDTKLYATLLDNLNYNRFLTGDSLGVYRAFNRTLIIRDSIKSSDGVIMSKLHLAEYFIFAQDSAKAIQYVKEANNLANNIQNNRDRMASLKLLAELDKSNKGNYLEEYIRVSDSLQQEDRRVRNKFTRISYETDKYVEETKRLSQQKTLISIGAGITILILSLSYFLIRQRSKNKELIFESEQQKNNEEIYKLILNQQAKLEEGRMQERHRISEELHDGVLGKLFGTRMSMGFLDITGNDNTLKQHASFLDEIQDIEKEIRTISHELKSEILSTKLGFMTIIENLVQEQSALGSFAYEIESETIIYWDEIPDKTKFNMYRILQESLFNITKYSKAKNVRINFNIKDKMLNLTVTDDGVGFDTNSNKKGIGISNMMARVKRLAGVFHVSSVLEEGTEISVSIPI